jgi:hypothetical protein
MLTGARRGASVEDYLRWLSDEASGLRIMFSCVNENFTSAELRELSLWLEIRLISMLCRMLLVRVVRMFF